MTPLPFSCTIIALLLILIIDCMVDAAELTVTDTSSKYSSFDAFLNRPGAWDDANLSPIFEANKNWIRSVKEQDPIAFTDAAPKVHAPKILWIGCADARVPANLIVGEPAGSIFVHRNIANMVVGTDANIMSVIQYAVAALKVKHIIVCGHYDCGGVKASMEKTDHGSPLEDWLRNIRDVYRLHKNELSAIPDKALRTRRLVELNVVEQCLNIYKTAVVQKRRAETWNDDMKKYEFAEPRIHALVYDPHTGELNRLPVDFTNIKRDLRNIYDLVHPYFDLINDKF